MFPCLALVTDPTAVVAPEDPGALIQNPVAILSVLLLVLAGVFWSARHSPVKRVFKVIPALVFCYFVPTTLTTLGVIPDQCELYTWVKTFLLPASLFLLILSLDLPAILRLGWKPVVMLLTGTAGVVVGGPVALFVGQQVLTGDWMLPPDAWKGLAALSGSWIGGGANFVAIGDAVGTSGTMLATMVVPDVLVANVWTGVLLYLAGHQHWIDRRRGVDATAIRRLEERLAESQKQVARVPSLAGFILVLAAGFCASSISYLAAGTLVNRAEASVINVAGTLEIDSVSFDPEQSAAPLGDARVKPIHIGRAIDHTLTHSPQALDGMRWNERLLYRGSRFINDQTGGAMWKYLIVTTLGLLASFTPVRRLEKAGASRVGTVMLYILVATIGATADFNRMAEAPGYLVVGFLWMAVHILFLVGMAWLIKAPVFYLAVGSQANIGGAASAPIVASAYHPSLAPVGVLLAVAGYVLGTYAGLLCAGLLRFVAGGG
jgi:uncharacterized membrane protein